MDKKIIDLISDIENIDLDLNEDQIKDLVDNKNIDYNQIKNLTMNKIFRKKRVSIKLLFVAAIIVCVGCTVFAYSEGYFNKFFGKNSKQLKNYTIRIAENQAFNGIKLLSADILYSDQDAVVVFALECEDGRVFPNSLFQTFNIKVDGKRRENTSMGANRSDDEKQYYYIVKIPSDGKPLKGKTLNISISELYTRNSESTQVPVNMLDYYNIHMDINSDDTDNLPNLFCKDIKPNQILDLQNKASIIEAARIGFVNNEFWVTSNIKNNSDKSRVSAYIDSFYNIRNSKTYSPNSFIDNHPFTIRMYEDIKKEDLKYLQPIIEYVTEDIFYTGNINFEYTFKDDGFNLKKEINIEQYYEGEGDLKFTQINVKALGIDVYGERPNFIKGASPAGGASGYPLEVNLILKDNTKIKLKNQGCLSVDLENSPKYFKYEFSIPTQDGETQFINQDFIDQIEYIEVNNNKIKW